MLFDIYLIKDLRDLSLFVDQERCAVYTHILLSVHAFLGPHAILFDYILVRIRNQVEVQSVLRAKLLMGLFVIDGNAEELYIVLVEFVVRITERTCFERSARGVVFRIEEQNNTLALKVGKLYGFAILIL